MSEALASGGKRLLGFATGLAFGALLQRGGLSRREVIVGQMLFRDGRVVKAMASAVAVGAVGFRALERKGIAEKDVKPMKVGGVTVGAVLFGAGLGLAGYCPGTSVAAVGEGRPGALSTVLGMLAGAGAFVALYPSLMPIIDAGDFGKRTLPGVARTARSRWNRIVRGATRRNVNPPTNELAFHSPAAEA